MCESCKILDNSLADIPDGTKLFTVLFTKATSDDPQCMPVEFKFEASEEFYKVAKVGVILTMLLSAIGDIAEANGVDPMMALATILRNGMSKYFFNPN